MTPLKDNRVNMELDLKHLNRRKKCISCEKQYLYTIKMLEKQIESLTEMLRMKHLTEKIIMPIPQGATLIGNEFDQPCLTEQCIKEDLARGGSGVANVSCSCPRCTPRC